MIPSSLPPGHEIAAPQSWRKELASIDSASPMEIGQGKHALRVCPHPDKVNGMTLEECRECKSIFSPPPFSAQKVALV